jgi:hypothetical protein
MLSLQQHAVLWVILMEASIALIFTAKVNVYTESLVIIIDLTFNNVTYPISMY